MRADIKVQQLLMVTGLMVGGSAASECPVGGSLAERKVSPGDSEKSLQAASSVHYSDEDIKNWLHSEILMNPASQLALGLRFIKKFEESDEKSVEDIQAFLADPCIDEEVRNEVSDSWKKVLGKGQ